MKILVCGPFQSGKSTFISALDKNSLNIKTLDKNNKSVTIAMDVGTYDCDGLKITLFGTPGLLRFNSIRRIVSEGADGVIFMFDGPNVELDDSAIQILNEIRSCLPRDIPIIYAVNKIDDPKCRDVEVVRKQNYIPKTAKMVGISALNGTNIVECLNDLVSMIRENLTPLVKTLEQYQGNALGLKVALGKSAEEIMELLNAMEIRGIISINRGNLTFSMNDASKFFTTSN